MKKLIFTFFVLNTVFVFGQWTYGPLIFGNTGSNLGTLLDYPIHIFTNNTYIARFSSPSLPCTGLIGAGQGLRIRNFSVGAVPGLGEIDIFSTGSLGSNSTEIRFGGSGNISGSFSRFEMHGNYNGLWFNATSGWTEFAHGGEVHAFIQN